MSKNFVIECPKCGSINTPPSALKFWQKEITCVTCGHEFNIKNSRMISKRCPNKDCGRIIVWDQKKTDKDKCPFCGTHLRTAATAEYKGTDVICPQCACQIEIDKTKEYQACPVCDANINVKEALAKSGLVSDSGVSVIKYEGDNQTFVWKHPIEDFNMGSQLIVHESQEAIFFLNGQALDLFGPGKYTLETENLPVLKKVYDLPTGKQKPFHAEVYFINKTVQMGIKWGTDSRVRFMEPETGIPLEIGASGEMNLQVADSRKLLVKLVGTTNGISWDNDSKNFTQSLRNAFRPLIVTTVKANLAAAIKKEAINILEIDEKLEVLSSALGAKVSVGFEEYGLTVPQFYVTNIALPEEDKNFKKIRELLGAAYLGVREAEVEADIIKAQRQKVLEEQATDIERAKFEAEKKRIAAQAEADATRLTESARIELKRQEGFSEAEVMQAKGYTEKDVLQADIQKAYAQGIGQMGSHSTGNAGGSMVSDMIGLGVGMAAMGTMGEKVGGAMRGFQNGAEATTFGTTASDAASGWKCVCGCENHTGKFCSECGKAKPELWTCPACGAKENKGKFCSECGAQKPELWDCPHCGAKGNKGRFCSECGKTKDAVNSWDCECGNKGITGKFCSQCGKKKEDNES